MKKEWIFQIIVLILFYLDSILEVSHEGVLISDSLGVDFLFLLFHVSLFLIVNYVLIPNLFYTKRFVLFTISLLVLIGVYGVLEEGFIEKILTPNTKGANDVTWQSIYWFFGEILVPLLSFMTVKFVFDNFEHQQKLEQIERDNLTNELKFLKSQIQPHLLFNSLNNLYDFTLSKSDKAPELVLKLSNVLRYVLYETSSDQVSLSKELLFLEDYIALQEMQLEERGSIVFEVTEKNEGSIEGLKIAPFLLIPFVENSFKHSLNSKNKGIEIVIRLWIEGEKLRLLVENNFEAATASTENLTTKGIGLKNVQKRLELLYQHRYQLQIQKLEDLYQVHFELNLEE